ncbi:MAG: DUF2520 domain-containing protein [Actinomycetaceae bacterium]|nr:DUF2520 domain-containing protein [Actinomycetaceae bacterium]
MADGKLKIGIISAGRVGSAFGSALRALGHEIVGAYAHSEASRERLESMLPSVPSLEIEEIVTRSELVLFAVPDDELAGLVSGLAKLNLFRPGQIVIHVAGRYGTSVLAPAAEAGALPLAIHPAMTFTGTSLDVARLSGCPCAVTGSPLYLPIAQALVVELGGVPVVIAEEDRALYHAALAHGANHLVTLIGQSMRILSAIGVAEPGEYLRPLCEAALDGVLRSGESSQTGPVVRGDVGTIREHLEALDALSQSETMDTTSSASYSDIPPLYRALVSTAADRAEQRRALTHDKAERVRQALEK